MKIGIVGFSFALTVNEPNPCNIKLAREVARVAKEEQEKGNKIVIVAQWEIARALELLPDIIKILPDHVVYPKKGAYLDSRMVMAEAAWGFRKNDVIRVIPIANPFLHLLQCRKLVREFSFLLVNRKINRIGFCKDSLQWWTRGPIQLIIYSVRLVLTKKRW